MRRSGVAPDPGPADEQLPALKWAWRHPWVRALVYVLLIVGALVALWRARAGYMFALQVDRKSVV